MQPMLIPFACRMSRGVVAGVADSAGLATGVEAGVGVGVGVEGRTVAAGVGVTTARLGSVAVFRAPTLAESFVLGRVDDHGRGRCGDASTIATTTTARIGKSQPNQRFTPVPIAHTSNQHNISI